MSKALSQLLSWRSEFWQFMNLVGYKNKIILKLFFKFSHNFDYFKKREVIHCIQEVCIQWTMLFLIMNHMFYHELLGLF